MIKLRRKYEEVGPVLRYLAWLAVAAFIVIWGISGVFAQQPMARATQEQIERTIGSLYVQNAQCGATNKQLAQRVQELEKQLADMKKSAK